MRLFLLIAVMTALPGCVSMEKKPALHYSLSVRNESHEKLSAFHLSNPEERWQWFSGEIRPRNYDLSYENISYDLSQGLSIDYLIGDKPFRFEFPDVVPEHEMESYLHGDFRFTIIIRSRHEVLVRRYNREAEATTDFPGVPVTR